MPTTEIRYGLETDQNTSLKCFKSTGWTGLENRVVEHNSGEMPVAVSITKITFVYMLMAKKKTPPPRRLSTQFLTHLFLPSRLCFIGCQLHKNALYIWCFKQMKYLFILCPQHVLSSIGQIRKICLKIRVYTTVMRDYKAACYMYTKELSTANEIKAFKYISCNHMLSKFLR